MIQPKSYNADVGWLNKKWYDSILTFALNLIKSIGKF